MSVFLHRGCASGVLQRVAHLLFEGPFLEHDARYRVAGFVAQPLQVQPDVPHALLPGPDAPHRVVALVPAADRGPASLRPVKIPCTQDADAELEESRGRTDRLGDILRTRPLREPLTVNCAAVSLMIASFFPTLVAM